LAATEGMSEAELLSRLEEALAGLPAAEREAVITALGYGEGSARVAAEQGLSPEQAEALTRSALQLLRGALADCATEPPELHPRGQRRRTRHPRAD
jgi:DNA-directed RNA polymerase specialized sigma24 family protein